MPPGNSCNHEINCLHMMLQLITLTDLLKETNLKIILPIQILTFNAKTRLIMTEFGIPNISREQ